MALDIIILYNAGLMTVGFILYCVGRLIYNAFWHPLARFPGPKLAAATKWYETYYELFHGQGGAFMYEIDRMHARYGPIVRVNPYEVHIRDPMYFRIVNAGAGARRDKYVVAANMLDTPLGVFGTVTHETHRRRRAVISGSFSRGAVLQAEDLIREHVETLYQLLRQRDVSECHTCFLAFGTDVISTYAFGYKTNLSSDMSRAQDWRQTLKAVESLTPLGKQFTWIIPTAKRLPRWIVRLIKPSIWRLLDVQDDMNRRAVRIVADGRRATEEQGPDESKNIRNKREDILQAVLNSGLPANEKSPHRIGQEGFTILVAGGDTVAWTISIAIFHLLSNPEAFASLHGELAAVASSCSGMPRLQDLEQLPWLNAVLKESLRVWGSGTSRSPVICPDEDLVYGDRIIPRGTPVSMTVRDILHDPKLYPEPLQFRPQRWLPGPDLLANERNFVPFSKGNRMCLGTNLAWAEMYLALAMVVIRFDMELVDVVKERDVDTTRDCFIGVPSSDRRGINVRFTPKEPHKDARNGG